MSEGPYKAKPNLLVPDTAWVEGPHPAAESVTISVPAYEAEQRAADLNMAYRAGAASASSRVGQERDRYKAALEKMVAGEANGTEDWWYRDIARAALSAPREVPNAGG